MGALHHGHAVLLAQAIAHAQGMAPPTPSTPNAQSGLRTRDGEAEGSGGEDRGRGGDGGDGGQHRSTRLPVVVSIFVNPTQFNESTDFARYPRVLEEDVAACAQLGVDVVFAPAPEVVYPPDETIPVGPIPAVATEPGLEDAFRPGHFEGVCQVVRRFFVLTGAKAAVFGEKDFQQLQTVRAMVRDEGLGVEIVPVQTVRETDGLALSSRNRLLRDDDRQAALAISRALHAAGQVSDAHQAEAVMERVLVAEGRRRVQIEYAAVRDAHTLGQVEPGKPARALIAARVGEVGASGGEDRTVRLLDNAPWPTGAVCQS